MILKLNDLRKKDFFVKELYGDGEGGEVFISAANIDDIFRALSRLRIKEIKVDFDTMFTIASYVLANITCHPHYNYKEDCDNKKIDREWNIAALKLIQEPKIDKFFGVKLHLE